MQTHEQKIERIAKYLKGRKSAKPLSLKKKAVSHEVPKPGDKRRLDEKLDISDLNEIINIDTDRKICTAEPGVTFIDLVTETLKHNLVPMTVPELRTITIGGAVAGCSIESMSYKYGGFHDSCLEYEIVTANGDVLTCTPENENKLLFQMAHGTFGTLGIITKLKFRLVPAKKYVKMNYEHFDNLDDYKKAIWGHFEKKDVDFMDGFIHSQEEYVLNIGNFVDTAPYTNKYNWTKNFCESTRKLDEDYLKPTDYFFRYDNGLSKPRIKTKIGRFFFGKLTSSSTVLRVAEKIHWLLPKKKPNVVVDIFVPFSKFSRFAEWYRKVFNYYAVWVVPYKRMRDYEWLSDEYTEKIKDPLFIDLAIYGMKQKGEKNYYRLLEEELLEIGGLKTLISHNFFSEEEFWRIWNKENYYKVKRMTDPKNIFRDIYTKMCRAARGL